MNPPPDLSIIIVNWNSRDYVRKCVQSIEANVRDLAFEIIVIDGASYDGCGEMLAREFPLVRFIQCDKNVGFAKANNLAFEQSQGGCVLFLNPDTEVKRNAIQTLRAELLRQPESGMVGAKLLNTDGTIQTSCIQSFPTILNQLLDTETLRRAFPRQALWGIAPLYSGNDTPAAVEVLSGACLMLRREKFVSVGRFSEDYFMYSEDLDLCHKIRASGAKNYYVPAAVVVHHGGGSSQPSQNTFSAVMMRESVFRFLTKVRGRWYGLGFRFSTAISALSRLGLLVVAFPVKLLRGENASARLSFRKWMAIFKWTIGLEREIAKYG